MWLIIRKSDTAVVGTQHDVEPTTGQWNSAVFEIKEWYGAEPLIHNPELGIESYDPTLTDPDYSTFTDARIGLDDIEAQATAEIAWLDQAIGDIDTADLIELRAMFKRVLQEQRQEIRAWRYVIRRLI